MLRGVLKQFDPLTSYVFHTQGVCPSEILFKLSRENTVHQLRFVGGGCPGNALLVGRLVEGKSMDALMESLSGIVCRNATSCPDQLARAFAAVKQGELQPATPFKVADDAVPRKKVCFIGNLDGNPAVLNALLQALHDEPVQAVYGVGNLTGFSKHNDSVVSAIRKNKIQAISGQQDWGYAQGVAPEPDAPLSHKNRDMLLQLPHVLVFQVGEQKGMAFYGRYILDLPGYSDFAPFSLEMNMICDLTRFMQDESVFPALEAMTPQFTARIVAFSEQGKWQSYHVGGVMFLGIGNTCENGFLRWGVLEDTAAGLTYGVRQIPFNPER